MFFGYGNILFPLSLGSIDPSPTNNYQNFDVTSDVSPPVSTACGNVIRYANEDLDNNFVFPAEDVYDCLTSVPFNEAVATRFVEYYNTTIQFQSTLAYLKNPPAEYQQLSVDVLSVLEEIQHNITTGQYSNQYDFEATIQALVYSMHDSHVTLDAGILSAFSFASPYDLMSVSVDGKAPPQVYLASDIRDSHTEGWVPSPVTTINGENVVEYLQEFGALNAPGYVEEHAEWNALMYSPVQDILGTSNIFGWDTTFYPGSNLTFALANGSVVPTKWYAIYRNAEETGPLETGGDFYNYFVLGLLPASFTENGEGQEFSGDDGNASDSSGQSSWAETSPAFPDNPVVVQPDLSIYTSGYISGYFYPDVKTGVLSIPSFDEYGDEIGAFSNTTSDFIEKAQTAGITRIVIDLQQNTGGATLLAVDTFKQFFPTQEPYAGSRRRSFQLGNILGGAMTNYWAALDVHDDDYEYFAANEWVITDRLNAATGRNFTSWTEYAGPVEHQGDLFSLVERYNLSSEIFDASAFGGYVPAGYHDPVNDAVAPWDAQDIVLLTDGICGSTCSLFVEMMSHEAGVRTIVAGGTPRNGPMQVSSGTRGASGLQAGYLDDNLAFIGLVNDTANATIPQVRDEGMWSHDIGFNLRDQVRANENVPLQFQYTAAQCRIYYTLANAYNMTRLWLDAAKATWEDSSLCVDGSTGFATSKNSTSSKPPPTYNSTHIQFDGIQGAVDAPGPPNSEYTLLDGGERRDTGDFRLFTQTCYTKMYAKVLCSGVEKKVCLPSCDNTTPCRQAGSSCKVAKKSTERKQSGEFTEAGDLTRKDRGGGYCVPKRASGLGCR